MGVEDKSKIEREETNMKELIKKLTSRKFISVFLVELVGILTLVLGAENPVTVITGGLLSVVAAVVYCITEGKVDAAALQKEATENLSFVMSVIANTGKDEVDCEDNEPDGEILTEGENSTGSEADGESIS